MFGSLCDVWATATTAKSDVNVNVDIKQIVEFARVLNVFELAAHGVDRWMSVWVGGWVVVSLATVWMR